MITEHEADQQTRLQQLNATIPLTPGGLPFYVYRLDALWQPTELPTPTPAPAPTPAPSSGGETEEPPSDVDANEPNPNVDADTLPIPRYLSEPGSGPELNLEDYENSDPEHWLGGHRHLTYQDDQEEENQLTQHAQQALEESRKIAGYSPETLQRARIPLHYTEAYPAFGDGRTFWSRWDWEPPEAYAAFQAYLHYQSLKDRPRLLEEMVQFIAHQTGVPLSLEKLTYYQTVYCWVWRATAHDQFEDQAFRFQLDQRAKKAMAAHYETATDLLDKLLAYLGDNERFWDNLNPKLAVDFLGKLTAMQRTSVGLSANGGEASKGSQVNVNVSQTAGSVGNADSGNGDDSLEALSQEALRDPETAELFQQLIIRLNRQRTDEPDTIVDGEFEEMPTSTSGGETEDSDPCNGGDSSL